MRSLRCRLAFACLVLAGAADAKKHGVSSPSGKKIYDADETFAQAVDSSKRRFVVEVSLGAGPEGNIGALLGVLNLPVRGLEYYIGYGIEANPATHITGSARYVFNIDDYRPYIALGYLYKDLTALRTYSHNAFAELGLQLGFAPHVSPLRWCRSERKFLYRYSCGFAP